MNKEKLLKIIDSLCDERGISRNAAFIESGVGKNFASNLKKCDASDGKLAQLAIYFGVSVAYLKGEETPPNPYEIPINLDVVDAGRVYMIPVYETVSAGFGALAYDEVVDHHALYFDNQYEAERTICIRVKGDSMRPVIEDGDLIQVRKQDAVDSGTLAVVLVDGGEGFVKRIEFGNNWIELQSLNQIYKPIRFTGKDMESVRVVGAVVTVLKDVTGSVPFRETTDSLTSSFLDAAAGLNDKDIDDLIKYAQFLKSRRR